MTTARSSKQHGRPDYAPLIARVVAENPPGGMGTTGVICWALRTWPEATAEEVLRAVQIADELETVDRIAGALG